jgi:hypothetical protein
MCDAMTEPPRPGTELFCFWNEDTIPVVGESREFKMGDWTLFIRILKVKDSKWAPDRTHVTMEVIG